MISKRLQEIANLINKNEVIIDVGTDHGLLPCFLLCNGISQKAYASDNKEGPLSKAKENIQRLKLEGKVIPILCDGLQNDVLDADVVVIAGMGTYTAIEILKNAELVRYKRFIVQVNNNVSEFRRFLNDNHFRIVDEKIVHDDFFYEIIVFDREYGESLSEMEIKYGPINLRRREEAFIEHLRYLKDKYERIGRDEFKPLIDEINGLILYNTMAEEMK